jgi:hypothetical protein
MDDGAVSEDRLAHLEKRVAELEAAKQPSSGAREVGIAVIGALGAGVGVLAIVTVFGGIAEIARFRGLKLPGTEAVARLPRQTLLASGADHLIPAVLAGVLAVALLYITQVRPGESERDDQAETSRERLPSNAAGPPGPDARKVKESLGQKTRDVLPRARHLLLGLFAVAGVAFYLGKAGWPNTPADVSRLVGMVAVVFAVWIAIALAGRPERFPSVGSVAAVVAAVVVYGAIETSLAAVTNPHIRAAALLRKGGDDIAGLWVGQSGDWIYVAEVDPQQLRSKDRHPGRILAVRRDSVTAYAFGGFENLSHAVKRAHGLLDELRGRFRQEATVGG